MSLPDPGGVLAPPNSPPSDRTARPRRAPRIIAAVVVLGLLLAGVGTVFNLLWNDTAAQSRKLATEREGASLLVPLTGLVETLTVARSVVARGGQVQGAPVQNAMLAVDAADDRYGADLGSHAEWSGLHHVLSALASHPGSGADGYQVFSDAITLVTRLIGDVAESSGLILDSEVDSYYLVDALVLRLPQVIGYAGQATDLQASSGEAPLTGENAASLAVARFQVALATSQLVADIKKSVTANAAVDLSVQQDALQDAVNQLSPPIVVAVLSAPVDAIDLAAAAQRVGDSALALGIRGWHNVDSLLATREHALQSRQRLTAGAGVGVIVSALALLFVVVPGRRRTVGGDDDTETPAPIVAEPVALRDARDLLLEELVHVGRGVRPRVRESADDAE